MVLTVIIPAAGKGSRLGLPYSKEVMKIDGENSLIDNVFLLFKNHNRDKIRFVIIINENKTDIVSYLSKYKKSHNICFCYQNPSYPEYTGAIKSAYSLFGENNIVILPDTIIKIDYDLYDKAISSLTKNSFFFLYKKEKSIEMLKTKGCLRVINGKVKLYEDKPHNVNDYNGFWCSFAFKKHAFMDSIEFMEKSTLKKELTLPKEIKKTPLYDSIAHEVEDYIDLGTWSEIKKYTKSFL